MVNDPYRVLGIEKGATGDEIKSAYRKMAKKYHPDLHPNDPNAAVKMNEINEAYDMLTHPEKYAKRRAESTQNTYSGYNPYSGAYNRSYSSSDSGSSSSDRGYRGAGGWYSDFGGFDFDDFFGFGNYNKTNASINPKVEPGDSAQFRTAVEYINSGRYQEAFRTLMNVEHSGRNARWYYLNALTLYGYGDTSQAIEYMKNALRMDPNNSEYVSLLNKFNMEGRTYYRQTTVSNPLASIGRIILIIIALRFIFRLLAFLAWGFMPFY